jgi:maltose O-acetyltransferase
MNDFGYRIINALLGTELITVGTRMRLMNWMRFDISDNVAIWPGASFRSRQFKIGKDVFINIGFFFDGYDQLTIGKNVRIGQFVRIITATHEIGPSEQRCPWLVSGKPVEIKDGSWIGTGAIILPGVVIEKGCVIAAGAVVTSSTRPDCLYGGVPAKLIRELK